MGVQGYSPGKLDRERSESENERSEISERSQLDSGGKSDTQ